MNAILTYCGELTISYSFDLEHAFKVHTTGETQLQEDTITLPHKVTNVAVGG